MNLSDITTALVQRGFQRKGSPGMGEETMEPSSGASWVLLHSKDSLDGESWLWIHDAGDSDVCLVMQAHPDGTITEVSVVDGISNQPIAVLESIDDQPLDSLLAVRAAAEAVLPGDLLAFEALLPSGWALDHALIEALGDVRREGGIKQ